MNTPRQQAATTKNNSFELIHCHRLGLWELFLLGCPALGCCWLDEKEAGCWREVGEAEGSNIVDSLGKESPHRGRSTIGKGRQAHTTLASWKIICYQVPDRPEQINLLWSGYLSATDKGHLQPLPIMIFLWTKVHLHTSTKQKTNTTFLIRRVIWSAVDLELILNESSSTVHV